MIYVSLSQIFPDMSIEGRGGPSFFPAAKEKLKQQRVPLTAFDLAKVRVRGGSPLAARVVPIEFCCEWLDIDKQEHGYTMLYR